MSAGIMDGIALSKRVLAETSARAADYAARHGRAPALAAVLVGDDPASQTYVRMKVNRSRDCGITSRRVELPASTSTDELVGRIRALSEDPGIDGILLQHPVPSGIDERTAFEAIAPGKDVDGVTRASFAAMAFGEPGFVSCTPGGIVRLLDEYGVKLAGRRAVVVGRSPILGRPVGMLLLARDATVTFCHSRTADLAAEVAGADILIAAAGRPRLVLGRWVKPGAVIVDAGYSQGNAGDVEFIPAAERASLITPVPGGVGPMTIAVLLSQTVDAAFAARGER